MRSILLFCLACLIPFGTSSATDIEAISAALEAGNVAEVLPALEQAADAGNTRALTMLAALYQRGQGVEKDPTRAIDLYRRAAELGDAEAQFNLGNIYLLGEGIVADEAWALTYYRDAATQGHELALRNMNQLYRAAGIDPPTLTPNAPGRVIEQSSVEPSVVPAPAVADDPLAPTTRLVPEPEDAQVAEAVAVPPPESTQSASITAVDDSPSADQPLASTTPSQQDRAAQQAGAMAAAELTQDAGPDAAIETPLSGAEMSADEREAIRLAQEHGVEVKLAEPQRAAMLAAPKAAEAVALSQAIANLNNDSEGAVATIESLATQDYAPAQFELARLHLAGQGMEQDVDGALSWLQRAADNGHAQAQFDLGNRFLIGAGVEPDDAMAITLFRDAANNGHSQARDRLVGIYAEAGLPLPELQRPRTLRPSGFVAAAASTPEAAIVEDAAGAIVERSQLPADATPSASTAVVPDDVAAGTPDRAAVEADTAAPATTAVEPYVEQRYTYSVIDHTQTPERHSDIADINPPKPDNHVVVAGGALAQARVAPVAAPIEQPTDELSAIEMAVEPAVEALDSVADDALVEVIVGDDGVMQEPEVAAAPATVAVAEAATAAEEPDAIAAEAIQRVGAGSLDVEASSAAAAIETDTLPHESDKRGFLGKLRDALGAGDDGQVVASRAPGSAPALAATAGQAQQDDDLKLVIAEQAEPDPVFEKPSIDDAKASLNAGDFANAAAQFTILANDGDAEAQAHIGYMTYQGEGITRDKAAAVEWYRLSAVQGNRDAQYNLAVAYAFGEGVPQDDPEAANWYRRAAEQGSAIAQYSLAVSYALGEGVQRSDSDAARWYRAAADQGYPAAQYNLAYMYRAGQGLTQSDVDALRWFLQAAQNGHASAQYSLGYMYRSGKGVARNIDEAIRWYRLAAAQGHPEARADLSSLAPDS